MISYIQVTRHKHKDTVNILSQMVEKIMPSLTKYLLLKLLQDKNTLGLSLISKKENHSIIVEISLVNI